MTISLRAKRPQKILRGRNRISNRSDSNLSAPKSRIARSPKQFLPQTRVSQGIPRLRTIFTHFLCRRNRGSLAIFFAEQIAHPGASRNRAIVGGSGRDRRRSRRESRDFGALRFKALRLQSLGKRLRDAVSKVLFRKRELTKFCGKLG